MAEAASGAALAVRIEQATPVPLAVDLAVGRNELLALVGPSGAGKTTLLRAVAGLMRPARGEISANGETWFSSARGIDLPPQARAAGLVFQDYALFPPPHGARERGHRARAYRDQAERADVARRSLGAGPV